MQTDVLIVGGGLAGLALADRLQASGRDWRLVEAQTTLGGRIQSPLIAGAHFDLGPAWFWPGKSRMEALIRRFGLQGSVRAIRLTRHFSLHLLSDGHNYITCTEKSLAARFVGDQPGVDERSRPV